MRTRLTDLLGVEYPVMLAGMGGVSYTRWWRLSRMPVATGASAPQQCRATRLGQEMAATRTLTEKPFGVDLLTAIPDTLISNVELLIEGGASAFVAGLGVPSDVVELCHDHGVLRALDVRQGRPRQRALDAGCDVVVAQGTEAGGHTGTVATMPLVPRSSTP